MGRYVVTIEHTVKHYYTVRADNHLEAEETGRDMFSLDEDDLGHSPIVLGSYQLMEDDGPVDNEE